MGKLYTTVATAVVALLTICCSLTNLQAQTYGNDVWHAAFYTNTSVSGTPACSYPNSAIAPTYPAFWDLDPSLNCNLPPCPQTFESNEGWFGQNNNNSTPNAGSPYFSWDNGDNTGTMNVNQIVVNWGNGDGCEGTTPNPLYDQWLGCASPSASPRVPGRPLT